MPNLITNFKVKEIAVNLDIPINHAGHHAG
jgi:hypothetical protein